MSRIIKEGLPDVHSWQKITLGGGGGGGFGDNTGVLIWKWNDPIRVM